VSEHRNFARGGAVNDDASKVAQAAHALCDVLAAKHISKNRVDAFAVREIP